MHEKTISRIVTVSMSPSSMLLLNVPLLHSPCFGPQTKQGDTLIACALESNKWMAFGIFSGHFLSLGGNNKIGYLESIWMANDHLSRSLGLCLLFDFYLPTFTDSSLQVYLRTSNGQSDSLVWSLKGYQGNNLIKGQASLDPSTEKIKVQQKHTFSFCFR